MKILQILHTASPNYNKTMILTPVDGHDVIKIIHLLKIQKLLVILILAHY